MLDETDLARWANGRVPIQDAMPYLTPSEREFIMTGYTEQDWQTIFGGDNES